jgi:cobyric acid synthase
MVRLKKYIKKLIMGKFYEDLDTLNDLIKKLDKKNDVSVFVLRAIKHAKENPQKSVSDIIKETKNGTPKTT